MAAILLSALLYSGCRKPTQPVTVTFLDAEGQGVPGDHPLISGVLQEFTQETGIRVNDLPTPEDNGSKLELPWICSAAAPLRMLLPAYVGSIASRLIWKERGLGLH